MLEKCKAESSCPQPSFVLVLNLTKAQPCLEFTELNMFKHLVHLSLVVLRASDTQLKDYLVTSITELSRDKEQGTAELQSQVDSLQQQLESSLEQLHARTGELEQVRSELSSQASSLERRLARDVEGEKERAGQQLQELQWKYEADKREAESKHAKVVQQLENRVASLDVQNRDLWEVRVGQESSLREARGQLQCRDEEVARLKRDMAGLRQEKVMVETVGSDRDKHVGQVTARLAKVERDLQDKEAQVTRIQEAASRIQEDTKRLESQLEEKLKLVAKRENTIKKLSAEIIKANEIISKLQVIKDTKLTLKGKKQRKCHSFQNSSIFSSSVSKPPRPNPNTVQSSLKIQLVPKGMGLTLKSWGATTPSQPTQLRGPTKTTQRVRKFQNGPHYLSVQKYFRWTATGRTWSSPPCSVRT